MQEESAKETLASAWQTANFVGAAFAGKLKKLNTYIKDTPKTEAPKPQKTDFEAKLARARRSK